MAESYSDQILWIDTESNTQWGGSRRTSIYIQYRRKNVPKAVGISA